MLLTSRIISAILSFIMFLSPIGIMGTNSAAGGVKEITVAADGSGDYTTISEARDAVRKIDKSKYDAINVMIKSGEYVITEPIVFTEEDSGTAECPVHYIGEEGATIIGGVKLTAADFKKTEGGFTSLFKEEVRDNIVSVDLKEYGFTAEMLTEMLKSFCPLEDLPFLSVNGKRQMLAQYPNNTWLHVGETVTHSADGTTDTAIDRVTLQTVEYGEDHRATVNSWSEALPIAVRARLFKLWCPGDTLVAKRYDDVAKIDIYFAGDHEPDKGTILYFYDIPEELDIPGEYIFDRDAVLYYYPTDEFETATMTVPLSNGIIKIDNADYLTFAELNLTSSVGKIFEIMGDNIAIMNCELSSCRDQGVRVEGNNFTLEGNYIHDIGSDAVKFEFGDLATLTGGNGVIFNNEICEFGVTDAYGYAVSGGGVNITVAHNDIHDGNFKGVHFAGAANAVAEYNDVWRVSLLSEDTGVMSADGKDNANVVFRYNYVHDCYPEGEAAKILDYNPDYGYYGTFAFYYDNGCSYIETYGNVVNGVDTGYLSNGGRCNTCHGNIFIDCRKWYIWFSEWTYGNALGDDGLPHGSYSLPEFVKTDAWKKANPDLCSLIPNCEGADPLDPMLWCAPAKDECYDNYIMYNKANRLFSNWGIRPCNIEKWVKTFSGDKMPDEYTANATYSSKRTELNIEEVINAAAGIADMDWDRFCSIGRIENTNVQ